MDGAREVFLRLKKNHPERSEFAIKLTKILKCLKRFKEGAEVLEGLFLSHPGHIEGHLMLGDIFMEQGFFKSAIEEYKRTLMINESYLPGHLGVARVSRILGDHNLEYIALKKAYSIDSKDITVILRLGEIEREQRMPASLERFRKILFLSPDSTQAREADYYLKHAVGMKQ